MHSAATLSATIAANTTCEYLIAVAMLLYVYVTIVHHSCSSRKKRRRMDEEALTIAVGATVTLSPIANQQHIHERRQLLYM